MKIVKTIGKILGGFIILSVVLAMFGGENNKNEETASNSTSTPQQEDVETVQKEEVVTTTDVDSTDKTITESTTGTSDIEAFKSFCDTFMESEFDYYNSYVENGILYIFVANDGIALGATYASEGNAEMKKSWDNMRESLIQSNLDLVESAKQLKIENPMISINVLNDVNKENVLLSMLNGAVISDAVNDAQ